MSHRSRTLYKAASSTCYTLSACLHVAHIPYAFQVPGVPQVAHVTHAHVLYSFRVVSMITWAHVHLCYMLIL
jgi:hypothetical protein